MPGATRHGATRNRMTVDEAATSMLTRYGKGAGYRARHREAEAGNAETGTYWALVAQEIARRLTPVRNTR